MEPLILVPCKSLAMGKGRLHPILTATQRQLLCRRFLVDTLQLAALQVDKACIRVVSPDPAVAQLAGELGIRCITEDGVDLNSALASAVTHLAATEPDLALRDILILPIDLARATQRAIALVLATPADVVLAPDLQKYGTNVLRLRGAVATRFRFQFGDDSFSRHQAEAARLQLKVGTVDDGSLAFDVDTPADYAAWTASR